MSYVMDESFNVEKSTILMGNDATIACSEGGELLISNEGELLSLEKQIVPYSRRAYEDVRKTGFVASLDYHIDNGLEVSSLVHSLFDQGGSSNGNPLPNVDSKDVGHEGRGLGCSTKLVAGNPMEHTLHRVKGTKTWGVNGVVLEKFFLGVSFSY
ncbi:hypothetical protein V6N13_124126 [Hibiscus sabdariffa]|uniref:Uncharacterized protein n=1 Tax=Hibiscus sabdariffa TaxID=183260 RepID=A0ABR2S0G5_9ROSI